MNRAGKTIVAALGASLLLVAAAPAAAPAASIDRVVTLKGAPAPGPSKYDRVSVHEFGPAKAKRRLVLMPGTFGGAGDFTLVAHYLVKHVPSLQVWAIDRRTQALEDTSMFRKALNGKATLQEMYDYYLGYIFNASITNHFQLLDSADYPFARKWGLAVALGDARRVVLAARKGGHEVILGGHSLGASLTVAYASWDFNGHPGYRDVDGLVLIDGGLMGSFNAYNLKQAKKQIGDLDTSSPFANLFPSLPFPEVAGLFGEVGGLYAKLNPHGDATNLQTYPLLPADLNPPVPVTNRALLAHAFDRDTSPDALGLLHINGGHLAAAGSPRDWADGGVTPVSRLAATFGQEPSNAIEWYFPKRLSIDTNGANALAENRVARYLGLRLEHAKQVDIPVYAIQTDLTNGGVLRGARAFIKRAKTTASESKLVNADPLFSHLDPLLATPAKNPFLKTVVPFLEKTFG